MCTRTRSRCAHAAVAATLLALFLAPSAADAAPILGAQVYALGGPVGFEVLPYSAAYTNQFSLFTHTQNGFQQGPVLALNNQVGTMVNLGNMLAGMELIFGIHVTNTGHDFLIGPASRNADGLFHAGVTFLPGGVAEIGFEDLWNGGDKDYNDAVIRVRGVTNAPPLHTPEPASLATWGLLVVTSSFARWRRARRTSS